MGRRCCIGGCPSTSRLAEHHGVTYHSFPLDAATRAIWVNNSRINKLRPITKSVVVCSRHFRRLDFQTIRNGKYLLKPGVFPTVFPWSKIKPSEIADDSNALKEPTPVTSATSTEAPTSSTTISTTISPRATTSTTEIIETTSQSATAISLTATTAANSSSSTTSSIVTSATATSSTLTSSTAIATPTTAVMSSSSTTSSSTVTPTKGTTTSPTATSSSSTSTPSTSTIATSSSIAALTTETSSTLNATPSTATSETALAISSTPTTATSPTTRDASSSTTAISSPIPTTTTTANRSDLISKYGPITNTKIGARLEAQNSDEGIWKTARIIEYKESEDRILIRFDRNNKQRSSTAAAAELQSTTTSSSSGSSHGHQKWFAKNSHRLRQRINTRILPQFDVNEKCMARWQGPRKFPGTVKTILDNDTYEILFDDGYIKNVRAVHMSKLPKQPTKRNTNNNQSKQSNTIDVDDDDDDDEDEHINLIGIELPEIDKNGEWTCHWINDKPLGIKSKLLFGGEKFKSTIIVSDWRLPTGWQKHMYQRQNVNAIGKWEVILVSPAGKQFRSKSTLKQFIESQNLIYNPDVYDFGIHRRRAKDINAYIYTHDYQREQQMPTQSQPQSPIEQSKITMKSPSLMKTPVILPLDQLMGRDDHDEGPSTSTSNNVGGGGDTRNGTTINIEVKPKDKSIFKDDFGLKFHMVDNLFLCPGGGCGKTYRKEEFLKTHLRLYHKDFIKKRKQEGFYQLFDEIDDDDHHTDGVDDDDDGDSIKFETTKSRKSRSSKLRNNGNKKRSCSRSSSSSLSGCRRSLRQLSKRSGNAQLLDMDIGSTDKPTTTATTISAISSIPSSSSTTTITNNNKMKIPNEIKFKNNKIKKITTSVTTATTTTNRKMKKKKQKKKMRNLRTVTAIITNLLTQEKNMQEKEKNKEIISDDDDHFKTHSFREVVKIVGTCEDNIINCLCENNKQSGLMIQCELCLCWQHNACKSILNESDVDNSYICYFCRNSKRPRESMRYQHDQDWLYNGKLPTANYHSIATTSTGETTNIGMKSCDILKRSHQLSGNLIEIKQTMHSLKYKLSIARRIDHPKLYLWRKSWEHPNNDKTMGNNINDNNNNDRNIDNNNNDNNIHNSNNNDIENNSLNSGENNVMDCDFDWEQDFKLPQNIFDMDFDFDFDMNMNIDIDMDVMNDTEFQEQVKEPEEIVVTPQECQYNLLNHIKSQQNVVIDRLQDIENAIDKLEMDDLQFSELNPEANESSANKTLDKFIKELETLKQLAKLNNIKNIMKPTFCTNDDSQSE